MSMVVVSFKLSSEDLERIEWLAQRLGVNRSTLIRDALRDYMNRVLADLEGGNAVEIDGGRIVPLKMRVVRISIPEKPAKKRKSKKKRGDGV